MTAPPEGAMLPHSSEPAPSAALPSSSDGERVHHLPTYFNWRPDKGGDPDLEGFWSRADGYFPEDRSAAWIDRVTEPLCPPPADADLALTTPHHGEVMCWEPGMVRACT